MTSLVNTETGEIVEALTAAERSALTDAEVKIERGLASFVEVGEALAEVRDSRLYREEHGTFEAYCRDRWGVTDRRVRQMIDAAEITSAIPTGTIVPVNEGQARELVGLDPTEAAEVMDMAAQFSNGRVTAAAIREAREYVTNPPEFRATQAPGHSTPSAAPANLPDLPRFSDWMSEHTETPERGEASTASSPFSGSDERDAADEQPVVPPAPVGDTVDLSDFINADPTVRLTSWRKHFMAAIAKSSDLLLFTPDDVAENAGVDLINELERLASDLNNYVSRVRAKRPTHLTALRGGKQ